MSVPLVGAVLPVPTFLRLPTFSLDQLFFLAKNFC